MSATYRNLHSPITRRRGAFAVILVYFVVVGIVAGGFVLNWAYGVLVQRDMHHKTDAFALAGARALLHPDLLTNAGASPVDIMNAVDAAVGQTLAASNLASPVRLQLTANNLEVTLGHVVDVTQKVDDTTFIQAAPYNTVRILAKREQADGNPVTHLINEFGSTTLEACEIGAKSYATLDNHVVGVLPTDFATAPVMPVAIEQNAWAGGQFLNNGIGTVDVTKFIVRLFCGGITPANPNSAVVGFNGPVVVGINPNAVGSAPYQVTRGIVPSDLPGPNNVLGPISAVAPAVVLNGRQTLSAAECNTMAAQFNAMVGGAETCRIFLLYDAGDPLTVGSNFRITGLIGARVLSTATVSDHLEVTVEKCFVVHPTVLTSPTADGPNPFVYKLRISR